MPVYFKRYSACHLQDEIVWVYGGTRGGSLNKSRKTAALSGLDLFDLHFPAIVEFKIVYAAFWRGDLFSTMQPLSPQTESCKPTTTLSIFLWRIFRWALFSPVPIVIASTHHATKRLHFGYIQIVRKKIFLNNLICEAPAGMLPRTLQ